MSSQHEQVGLRELRTDARRVVERTHDVGVIEITDRGKVIALLSPVGDDDLAVRAPKIARAVAQLRSNTTRDTGSMEFLLESKRAEIDARSDPA